MLKKRLFITAILTVLATQTSQNPTQLSIPLKAALKGGKTGIIYGAITSLPAALLLNGYVGDKILVPFISGLCAGSISFTTSGIYAWLKNNPKKQEQAIKLLSTAKGMGLSFGITAGFCAIIMAHLSDMRIGIY